MRLSEEREAVDRLYHRLADALRRSRVEPFSSPVTVAEIYQELVPYRQVRDELGFGMNADYEHALLCLLAGEGDHVRLEPDSARNAITKELKTSNPNVSIYREYAGCDAWVAEPAAGTEDGDSQDDESALDWLEDLDEEELGAAVGTFAFLEDEAAGKNVAADEAEPAEDAADDEPDVDALVDEAWGEVEEPWTMEQEPAPAMESAGGQQRQQDRQPVRSEAGVNGAKVAESAQAEPAQADQTQAETAQAAPHCQFCDSALPDGRVVRFCPFCGSDQSKRPCPSCDEVLEAGWVFCIACGSAADGA